MDPSSQLYPRLPHAPSHSQTPSKPLPLEKSQLIQVSRGDGVVYSAAGIQLVLNPRRYNISENAFSVFITRFSLVEEPPSTYAPSHSQTPSKPSPLEKSQRIQVSCGDGISYSAAGIQLVFNPRCYNISKSAFFGFITRFSLAEEPPSAYAPYPPSKEQGPPLQLSAMSPEPDVWNEFKISKGQVQCGPGILHIMDLERLQHMRVEEPYGYIGTYTIAEMDWKLEKAFETIESPELKVYCAILRHRLAEGGLSPANAPEEDEAQPEAERCKGKQEVVNERIVLPARHRVNSALDEERSV